MGFKGVTPFFVMDIEKDIILGLEFMRNHQVKLDTANLKMSIGEAKVNVISAEDKSDKRLQEEQDYYEIEMIIDKKWDAEHERDLYKVRWKNFEPEHDTWEPIEHLASCGEELREFRANQKKEKLRKRQEYELRRKAREKKRVKKEKNKELDAIRHYAQQHDHLSATEPNTKPRDPFVEPVTNKVVDTGSLGDTTGVIMTERMQRQRGEK